MRIAPPLILTLSLAFAACGDSEHADGRSTAPEGPVGPAAPPEQPTVPQPMGLGDQPILDTEGLVIKGGIAAQKIELGAMLFFDPRLSGSGKMSCSTCHLPDQGWTDGKRFSPKDNGALNKRNTPTLVNAAYCDKLYWDGRAPGLDANILAAWTGQMSADTAKVAETLAAVPAYRERFEAVFQSPPHERAIVQALSMFVRMRKGENAPFDAWRAGDADAVSADAKAGYALFMSKAGCVLCHQEPLFTDKSFHNTGIGMDAAEPDLGRGAIVKDPKLNGYFKTPSLRDVALTAPYFHDGSVATLEEAVRFMAKGGLANPTKSAELVDRNLSDAEIGQLVAFLESLTGTAKFTPPQLPE
ncbi:MAG: cytochrome-c peroxidase [Planctomycetota bacterium]